VDVTLQGVTAAVVLAAGASTRLGFPKQLVTLGGETLLDRAVRVALEAGCVPVVVLGSSAALIRERCAFANVRVVVNYAWASGMGSSIRCGVEALIDAAAGCVVMTCDMPAVTPSHLRALIDTKTVTASGYAGRRGVPAYFPASAFQELMELSGDRGARGLLQHAPVMELPGGEFDVDTEAEWARVRASFS